MFFERGQRRIPIYYARRTVGRRVYGGQTAHLPLKVNTAGTIPPIFASSLLMFPATLAGMHVPGMAQLQSSLERGDWLFNVFYVALIVFFCFFYTAVTFQSVDVADNLKKQQAFIPSIRQGKQTAEYIDKVLTRITLGGAFYVAAVCVVPTVISEYFKVPFRWGGTSIMIVVGVALDTVYQIEAHLITRNYEGLSGGGGRATRVRGQEGRLMSLVFVGPPGAGKGTQAKVICEKLGRSRRSRPATCSARRRPTGRCRRSSSRRWTPAASSRTRSSSTSSASAPTRMTPRADSCSTAFRGRSRRPRRSNELLESRGMKLTSLSRSTCRGAPDGASRASAAPTNALDRFTT